MASPIEDGPSAARQCLDLLRKDISHNDLSQTKREATLGQLKVLGRDLTNIKSLYDIDGFKVIAHYGFGAFPRSTTREALRCMANTLLLMPQTQKYFAELNLLPQAMQGLHTNEDEDEFLLSRILFLMTYSKTADFEKVADEYDLPASMITSVRRHAQGVNRLATDGTATAALSDTLKLMFNVTHAFPKYSSTFSAAVPDMLKILVSTTVLSPPLQPPLVWRLNALASVDFVVTHGIPEQDFSPDADLSRVVDKLVEVLDKSLKAYKPTQLDTQAIPLITILRKMNNLMGPDTRSKLKAELLPKDSERNLPLGQSSSLASRLLRLTTQPGLVNLPTAVSSLLFELSDSDARSFVKNVGYGYAAGYLMTHKIPIPDDVQRPSSSRGTVPINPVTGQRLDKEPEMNLPEMTEDEKEREAERLFVLFERLKATGVVDVQNPATMRQAKEEGRFQEVEDSD